MEVAAGMVLNLVVQEFSSVLAARALGKPGARFFSHLYGKNFQMRKKAFKRTFIQFFQFSIFPSIQGGR